MERTKSEDQDHTYSEKTVSNSQSSELPTEPVKEDTEPSSKPTDQTHSSNDLKDENDKELFKPDSYFFQILRQ